jgi:hypothetical protein
MELIMNTFKRIAFAGTLAIAIVTVGQVDNANASKVEKPFEKYGDCIDLCVAKYGAWTFRRSLCGADCYLELLGDISTHINPFN